MKNIYEYGEELYDYYLEKLPSKEFTIKRYEGDSEDLQDFIDVLEVIAPYKRIDWAIYQDKEDDDYIYIETWKKDRDLPYKENIREDMKPNYLDPTIDELHDLLDTLIIRKRLYGEEVVDFTNFMKKFYKIK